MAHLFYGAAIGLLLYYLTKGRFSSNHVIIITVNSYIGPDLAWLIRGVVHLFPFPGWEQLGNELGSFFHDPFRFMLLALLLAVIYSYLTKLGIEKGGKIGIHIHTEKGRPLKYLDCYQVIVAGGLSHFLLDYLFHPNTDWYVWVMGTGDWLSYPAEQWYLMLPVIGTAIIVICFAVAFLIILSKAVKDTKFDKFIFKVLVFAVFVVAMSAYLLFWMFFGPTQSSYPAVSEEADYGIFVFFSIFIFVPLALCINSYERFGQDNKYINWIYKF